MVVSLSVIIPALNAGESLAFTLRALQGAPQVGEVIVADGGSEDATVQVAEAHGARVVRAPRGRGAQLSAGAELATGQWFLFLHADTIPAPGWQKAVADFMAAQAGRERAAVFRFALDDPSPAARRLEAVVDWRSRKLGLPYGDQGLLISRDFYTAIGGYKSLPLMEDVDLVRRVGRRRLAVLDGAAVTSAARYRRTGYLRRSLRNLGCLALYFLGVPTPLIARLYG